jgi:Ca2+/Na+ antiporter
MMVNFQFGRQSRMGGIGCLLFVILGVIALFYVLKWTFTLLFYASPLLFLLALVIKPQSVLNAFRWLGSVYRSNVLLGLIYTVLGVLCFPVVALALFMHAASQRDSIQQNSYVPDAEYTDFEEVESEPLRPMAMPEPAKPEVKRQTKDDDPYEQLF